MLSVTYGAGDGTTTFNIPDLRGRVPVGVDGTAARLTANDALGNSGGEEKHQLLKEESANGTLHNFAGVVNIGQLRAQITDLSYVPNYWIYYANSMADWYKTFPGAPHNNMQPFLVTNFIVRVL